MNGFTALLIAYLFGPFAITMLAYGLFTSLILLAIIVIGTLVFEKEFSKHERSEAYDDRLSDQRMREATEDLIRRWKKKL
jgi:hypothetical protein